MKNNFYFSSFLQKKFYKETLSLPNKFYTVSHGYTKSLLNAHFDKNFIKMCGWTSHKGMLNFKILLNYNLLNFLMEKSCRICLLMN